MATKRPIRVLHVVYRMDRAGTETWLMNVLRRIDRSQFQMDFLVDTAQPGEYDHEIRELGSNVIPCARASRPWKHYRELKHAYEVFGPYDIVHCHVAHAGLELALFRHLNAPVRIAHSHSDRQQFEPDNLTRRLVLKVTTPWINHVATHGLAVSEAAAVAMFGEGWRNHETRRILYCGIDVDAFDLQSCSDFGRALREEFGIPRHAPVVGHVGRFGTEKNHRFLVEIAAEVVKALPEVRFVLVGVGPLQEVIMSEVADRGLTDHFIFAGQSNKVPKLMRHLFDMLLFPSLFEGLPLVVLEAQTAGLPCVLSAAVPPEADIVPQLITRLPLTDSAETWSMAVLGRLQNRHILVSKRQSIEYVRSSDFNIDRSVARLVAFYEQCLGQDRRDTVISRSRHEQ